MLAIPICKCCDLIVIDPISPRLLDQRLRNRIIESIEILADGDKGVREVGASDWFNIFFDNVPDDGVPYPNLAMAGDEFAALGALAKLVNKACDATPQMVDDNILILSGWPKRIAPEAAKALKLFMQRGKLSEEMEQT